jgi:hypothetical protein
MLSLVFYEKNILFGWISPFLTQVLLFKGDVTFTIKAVQAIILVLLTMQLIDNQIEIGYLYSLSIKTFERPDFYDLVISVKKYT